MAQGTGFAQAAADGINGYIKGYLLKKNLDNEEEDRAWKQEQRQNARTDRARADQLRTDLQAASAPAVVDIGAGGVTKPATADNSDVGLPGEPGAAAGGLIPGALVNGQAAGTPADAAKTAAAYDSQDAQNARLVAAYRKNGLPMEAQKLETEAVQGAQAKFNLSEAQDKRIREDLDRKLAGVTDLSQAGEFMTSLLKRPVTPVVSPDNKTVQFVGTGPDGQQVMIGKPFSNDRKGLQEFITSNSQTMTAAQRVETLRHMDDLEERANQHLETVRHNKATEAIHVESNKLHAQSVGIAAGHLKVAQGQLALAEKKQTEDLRQDPTRNLPGGDKLLIGIKSKQIDAIDAALLKAQTEPGFNPKDPNVLDMVARRSNLERERDTILSKYVSDYKPAKTYPFGSPAAASGVAPPASMIGGGVRDPSAPGGWRPQGEGAAAGGATAPVPAAAAATVPSAAASGVPAATAPSGAPGAPQGDQLLTALGATGSDSASRIVAAKAPVLRAAADTVRAAQAEVVNAARSQNPDAVRAATAKVQAAAATIDDMLKDMNPPQAQAVRAALGL